MTKTTAATAQVGYEDRPELLQTCGLVPFVTTALAEHWETRADYLGVYLFVGAATDPYYRLTPAVTAWVMRKMDRACAMADDGDDEIADILVGGGGLLARWRVLLDWATREYGDEAIAAAVPGLPMIGVDGRPPRGIGS